MTVLTHRTDAELVALHRETGEEALREALILRHTKLVRAIARRYARRGLAFDDIVQSGYLWLIQAVDRFDPSRGVPLQRYAARMVEGEIMHLFRDRGWAVRVPRTLQELSRKVAAASEQLGHQLGRQPTIEELAQFVEEDPESVVEAMAAQRAYHAESLSDGGLSDEGSAAGGESRPQRVLSSTEHGFDDTDLRDELGWAMRHLPPRERTIVALRFLEDMTQSEIADRLGISQMHVSRLLRSSLDTLRETVESGAAA